jgi:predicted nucleotidyltransferase
MEQLIIQHRPAIEVLCQRYRVQRLELFGSAATDGFRASRSDVDFLVEFQSLQSGAYADAYFGLLAELESLFQRHVDLVMVKAITNPYFLAAIEKSRTLLYAA